MKRNYKVYKITTPDEMVYVGYTGEKKVEYRWRKHIHQHTTLEPYIEKFGFENLLKEVVESGLTKMEAIELEGKLIDKYKEEGRCINKVGSGGNEMNKIRIRKQKKVYYEEHKEEIRGYQKIYREEHKEEKKQKDRLYYENNKEKWEQYREEHKEEIRGYQKIYREKNREKLNEKNRQYREEHKEKCKMACKRWYEEHKEEIREKRKQENRMEKRLKPLLQLTLTGELVREWTSIKEAGINGFNQSNIAACCRGLRKSHKGFRWEYKK